MRVFSLFAVILFTSVSAFSTEEGGYYFEKGYTSNVNHDDGISYDGLVEKMQASGAQTLEQTLDLVPQEFYQNYVLVYRSRSLQDSSPLFPRAIVFGRSSKFIMAFNGHKKQKGYNNLEIIQFREKEFRWEFREITFNDGKAPSFSEANPKKCLECHQSPKRLTVDPRPNWEPYNFWPGVYASVDSKIDPVLKDEYEQYISGKKTTVINSVLMRFEPQDRILVEEQALEKTNLEKFFSKIHPTHERYKRLGIYDLRAPLSFTKSTVILNMRRVARIVREELGDLFSVYKYALMGLGDAESLNSSKWLKYACHNLYMPETVREKHLEYTLKKRKIAESQYKKSEKAIYFDHGVAAGFDITLMPLGILTDDLSMDFKTEGRFSFRDRFSSPHDSATHFREAMMIVYADDPAVEMDCKQLREASEKALSDFEHSGGLDRALLKTDVVVTPVRPLVNRCISCHVNYEDGGQAPHIPFDDFQKLKPLLSQDKYLRGTLLDEIVYRTGDHATLKDQMPPAGLVEREQREIFIQELKSLLK